MHHPPPSLFVLAALALAPHARANVLIESFEGGEAPSPWAAPGWLNAGKARVGYTQDAATEGAASLQFVFDAPEILQGPQSPGGFYYGGIMHENDNFALFSGVRGLTGISADVWFRWENIPQRNSTGVPENATAQVKLGLKYMGADGVVHDYWLADMKPATGKLANGTWATLTWKFTPAQLAVIAAPGNKWGGIVFTLSTTEDVSEVSPITLRFDNIIALTDGATASK